jgi:predicted CXXCH cytochrome family protein
VLVFPLQWLKFQHQSSRQPAVSARPHFVGGEACIECHKIEFDLWKHSDHDLAMDIATAETVLGDFNDAVFVSDGGDTSRFYKKDGRFFVFTNGPAGIFSEFEIAYTFGWWPLQQYLIPFENGKLQTLHLTWDSRDERWYDMSQAVYPDQEVTSDNWLYWTNQAQNWNGMCADCHSTNLQKNYTPETDAYQTTWSDIAVNCESCHGPGSAHLDWAKLPEMARPTDNNTALIVNTRNQDSRAYADLCARCHLRRSALGDFDHFNGHLLDHYIPELSGEPYYYSDGQILEENYVYGSFLQSRMFMQDVKCNDCHNAHSLKLVKTGNDLCLQCHRPEEYDNYRHHFHKTKDNPELQEGNHRQMYNREGEGALCINCHMDGRFYMGVDYRRDHSFRIPRPDLTISLGVPNACNSCHDDQSAQWAENYITEWYGKSRTAHYGSTIAGGEHADTAVMGALINIANASTDLYPVMVRATALALLRNYPDEKALNTLILRLTDEDPVIRHYAVRNLFPSTVEQFKSALIPMLADPVKAVRAEAALRLSQLPAEAFDASWKKVYDEALAEYEEAMKYVADFPTGSYNLANLYSRKGNAVEAEKYYRKAILTDNLFYPAKINLAMVYNTMGENEKAEQLFREVITNHPEQTEAYYSLGLLLAEMNQLTESAEMLEMAAELIPERARIFYNLGLIYQYINRADKAEKNLLKAVEMEPGNQSFIYALVDFYTKTGNRTEAAFWQSRLIQ